MERDLIFFFAFGLVVSFRREYCNIRLVVIIFAQMRITKIAEGQEEGWERRRWVARS